jgi:hypothetical protein
MPLQKGVAAKKGGFRLTLVIPPQIRKLPHAGSVVAG